MANEFIARKGLKILEISEENTLSGSTIPVVNDDGTVKKISIPNFYSETGIEGAVNTATQQAILSASARDLSESYANDAVSAKIAAEDAEDVVLSATTLILQYQNTALIQNLGNISGNVSINLLNGTLIKATLTDAVSLSFTGLPTSDKETAFTLRFSGIFQITFPVGTKFANDIAPTLEAPLYELPCSIDSAGNVIVYGSINKIQVP